MKAIESCVTKINIKPTDFFRCRYGVGFFAQTGAKEYQAIIAETGIFNRVEKPVTLQSHRTFTHQELLCIMDNMKLEEIDIISVDEFTETLKRLRK